MRIKIIILDEQIDELSFRSKDNPIRVLDDKAYDYGFIMDNKYKNNELSKYNYKKWKKKTLSNIKINIWNNVSNSGKLIIKSFMEPKPSGSNKQSLLPNYSFGPSIVGYVKIKLFCKYDVS